ncbi:hypothetical protein MAM1_0488d10713 [Mucor ambiguus]|uniref:GATA-type domain-containing protein n=1 Tax=Mucor ambiguus TaxID=91626 RepID=A0A0C9LYL5_9FUNG|nr:hypothetical protein MAM1_0488d10713 [Mucor ambiguus]
MDVSQLCSSPSDSSPTVSSKTPCSTIPDDNKSDTSLFGSNKNPSTSDDYTSIANVLNQCSKLCESIWQLKLQHNTISSIEREIMIDNLSESAKQTFRDIQLTGKHINKEKHMFNKRRNQHQNNYEDDDDDDDDDDEDEDEEQNEDHQNKSVNKDHAEYELIRQARNLQNSNSQSRPKYRRRNRRNMIGQKCHSCGTTETPEWRRGPDGARTLCNACGLHYSKLLKRGSIGVQTQNYLITGGSPQVSAISSSLQAQSIRNSSANMKTIEAASTTIPVNYPFVLMDPKYLNRGLNSLKHDVSTSIISTSSQRSYYTPSQPSSAMPSLQLTQQKQLPSLSSTLAANDDSKFVNINQPEKVALPSLTELQRNISDNQVNKNYTSTSTTTTTTSNTPDGISESSTMNSIAPLRIHQWKQNE